MGRGASAAGHRWLAGERIIAYAAAAFHGAIRGGDPTPHISVKKWPGFKGDL